MIAFMLQRREELARFPNTVGRAVRTNGVGQHSDYHLNLDVPLAPPPSNAVLVACSNIGHLWLHSSGSYKTHQSASAWRGTSAEFRKLRESVPFARTFHLEAEE